MTKEEYEELVSTRKKSIITISTCLYGGPRTLIYGYDVDRNSVHLYCTDRWFTYVRYDSKDKVLEQKDMYEIPIETGLGNNQCYYVPNKRVYWDRSDFEFCNLLKKRGVDISFTDSRGNVMPQQYYGKTLAQLCGSGE